MAKKKKDLDKDREKFLSQARESLKELKDCDFEEFKELIIELGEQLLAGQFMMMEWLGEERQKLFNQTVESIKQIRVTNDEDFKKAERNFQQMFKIIDDFEKRVSKAEATSLISLMYTCAGLNAMGVKGYLTDTTLNKGLKLIPKRVKKHITDSLEMEPKRFDTLLAEAIEATA